MAKQLEPCQNIERSIIKKFRKQLWRPFIDAVKRYELVQEGDRIAVCISGGKDSMLMAKLMQELKRQSKVNFELRFLVMDPGYNRRNREKIESNAALLQIPLTVFETDVFDVANSADKNPCYLCARMRRGYLYSHAKETPVMSMFYGGQIQAMLPKLHSKNFEGMELIRPMYCIHEDAIIEWMNDNGLEFIQCACRFTEKSAASEDGIGESKRKEIKELIRALKQHNPNIEKSIFNSIHNVNLDTMPGYKSGGRDHSFLERFYKGQEDAE